jgi:hypothetical protein
MKPRLLLIVVWLVTGLGAVGGSILGNAGGKTWLFVGAAIGGVIAAVLAVRICARLGWLPAAGAKAASAGAVIGFLVAAPIAATNLHTPVIPVLACSLAGAGALIGLGRARL